MSGQADPLAYIKQVMPNTRITGGVEQLEIVLDVNDIANSIVDSIKRNGYNCTYEIKGNSIIIKVRLGFRAG